VWKSTIDGQVLTFRLVGLNNQNFIMADEQTGTWWQQVTGEAVAGPLKGRRLEPVFFEQVTWEVWSTEHPGGTVLESRSEFAERYWPEAGLDEKRDGKKIMAFPMDADPEQEIEQGELVIALRLDAGREKAYPLELLRAQNPITDRFGGRDVLLVVAVDDRSVRAFDRVVDGRTLEFYRLIDETGARGQDSETREPSETRDRIVMVDSETGERLTPEEDEDPPRPPIRLIDTETQSEWDFSGTAISGPLQGTKLTRLQVYSDYWFDWNHFHPDGLVYAGGAR
jgi:hypothetical protein